MEIVNYPISVLLSELRPPLLNCGKVFERRQLSPNGMAVQPCHRLTIDERQIYYALVDVANISRTSKEKLAERRDSGP